MRTLEYVAAARAIELPDRTLETCCLGARSEAVASGLTRRALATFSYRRSVDTVTATLEIMLDYERTMEAFFRILRGLMPPNASLDHASQAGPAS